MDINAIVEAKKTEKLSLLAQDFIILTSETIRDAKSTDDVIVQVAELAGEFSMAVANFSTEFTKEVLQETFDLMKQDILKSMKQT